MSSPEERFEGEVHLGRLKLFKACMQQLIMEAKDYNQQDIETLMLHYIRDMVFKRDSLKDGQQIYKEELISKKKKKKKKWRPKPCHRCGQCIYRNGEPSFISWRSIICDSCLQKTKVQ